MIGRRLHAVAVTGHAVLVQHLAILGGLRRRDRRRDRKQQRRRHFVPPSTFAGLSAGLAGSGGIPCSSRRRLTTSCGGAPRGGTGVPLAMAATTASSAFLI